MYKCLSCKEEFTQLDMDLEQCIFADLKACVLCNSEKIIIGKDCDQCKTFTNLEDLQQVITKQGKKVFCKSCKLKKIN